MKDEPAAVFHEQRRPYILYMILKLHSMDLLLMFPSQKLNLNRSWFYRETESRYHLMGKKLYLNLERHTKRSNSFMNLSASMVKNRAKIGKVAGLFCFGLFHAFRASITRQEEEAVPVVSNKVII